MTDEKQNVSQEELSWRMLRLYLEIYQHHFNLLLKGTAVYFAIIGGVAGYVFLDRTPGIARIALSFVGAVFSLIAIIGCVGVLRWIRKLEESVHELQKGLGLDRYSFSGARTVVRGVLAGAIVLVLAATVNMLGLLLSP